MTRSVCPRSRRLSSASTWSGVRLRSSRGRREFAIDFVLLADPRSGLRVAHCFDSITYRAFCASGSQFRLGPASLLGQERERLQRADLKGFAAADVDAGKLVIAANHVGLRLRKPGSVALIGIARQLRPLAAHHPGDLVFTRLPALRAGESVGAQLCRLIEKFPLFH